MKEQRITSQDDSANSRKITQPSAATSEALSGESRGLRHRFDADLEQLKIQVELMALKVDEAISRSTQVLLTGDLKLAEEVIVADDTIDEMFVSLSERCYDLLSRQQPVASDLRLVVSVLRILSDLERTGDLCLRIVKLAPDQHLLTMNPETFQILEDMAQEAAVLFRSGLEAWSTQNLQLARSLEQQDDALDLYNARLMRAILAMEGRDAVRIAVTTLLAGRALERIADHSVMIGERLRYMLTGDIGSLSKEIGP
jgi:phosphate transport system protein